MESEYEIKDVKVKTMDGKYTHIRTSIIDSTGYESPEDIQF
jgi:hypothetical protein